MLAVCADDFGMSMGVSQVIARLAQTGRINATSCLTNAGHWRPSAPLLKELPDAVDVGLHFNLSEGEPLSADLRRVWPQLPTLPGLIANAHLGRLPLAAIAAEFAAQHAAFVETVGRAPAFVDGHQHVHHLPGIRELVLDALGPASSAPAVRNTGRVRGPGFGIKRALIAGTGGKALQQALMGRGMAHNAALVGVYDFVPGSYRTWMKGWLASVPPEGALLFCHPGAADGVGDAIASARAPEAEYFASEAFADDLLEAKVSIGRVWRRAL
jgi:hypothetical protein